MMSETETEPCRHCGTETSQRADGKPYCSMDCISARRREKNKETFYCPFPGCEWSHDYRPESTIAMIEFSRETEKHREEHLSE